MDRIIATVVGLLCGIVQFLIMRYTLAPLARGENIHAAKVLLLRLPVPAVLLLGCAFINSSLLPFAGIAFCLSLTVAGAVNHLLTMKKKG